MKLYIYEIIAMNRYPRVGQRARAFVVDVTVASLSQTYTWPAVDFVIQINA